MPETYYLTNHTDGCPEPIGTTTTNTIYTFTVPYSPPEKIEILPEHAEIVGESTDLRFHVDGGDIKLIKYNVANPLNVDRIIFSPPATIVFWKDGTKTVVKCAKGEPFSEYNGFAAALLKKVFGSNSAVKKIIQRKKQYDASAKATPASAQTTTLEQRFKELVNEYEHLKNRAENLNLYLRKVETTFPVTWLALLDEFSDMPGYESIMEESYGK